MGVDGRGTTVVTAYPSLMASGPNHKCPWETGAFREGPHGRSLGICFTFAVFRVWFMLILFHLASRAPKAIFKAKLMLLFCHKWKCSLQRSLFVCKVLYSCALINLGEQDLPSLHHESARIVQHCGPESGLATLHQAKVSLGSPIAQT